MDNKSQRRAAVEDKLEECESLLSRLVLAGNWIDKGVRVCVHVYAYA
jgi:hypothetical protein